MTTSAKKETIKKVSESKFQELCKEAVGKHVYACQSYLVDEMLKNQTFSIDDIENHYEHKCPECGHGEKDEEAFQVDAFDSDNPKHICPSCKEEFTECPESEAQEILEWWLVSDNFEYNLKEKGHPFLKNDYGTWWGRCCSGQAIALDGDIRAIVTKWEHVTSNNKY